MRLDAGGGSRRFAIIARSLRKLIADFGDAEYDTGDDQSKKP